MTVAEALVQATTKLKNTSQSPRLDAEVLLGHILKQKRTTILINGDKTLAPVHARRLKSLILQRVRHVPIPYLTGQAEFFGITLQVTPAVLVPRPFTELLVEKLLHYLTTFNVNLPNSQLRKSYRRLWRDPAPGGDNLNLTLADIGTGSGAIALALAQHLPQAKVVATDISPAALRIAKLNAKKLHLEKRVVWRRGSLLQAIRHTDQPTMVVANLPYLTKKQLREPSIRREPRMALDGGAHGLVHIRQLINQAERFPSITTIALEFDPSQLLIIRRYLKQWSPNATITTISDGRKVRGLIAEK